MGEPRRAAVNVLPVMGNPLLARVETAAFPGRLFRALKSAPLLR